MKTMIHSSLSIKAFEHAHIPVGGALKINEGGENDGTYNFDCKAEDFPKVMSGLTGAVLALHTEQTLVMPSNADRLNDALNFLKSMVADPNLLTAWMKERGSLIEMFESFVDDIESVQRNLTSNRGDR